MPRNSISSLQILPILAGFFVMGFADVVGISANYIKQDFQLTDTITNLLPFILFLWFAVFSIPTSLLMNKIGRKNTVLVSFIITAIALFLPLLGYTFSLFLFAFCLLGIGNAVLQVSLNPLLASVVSSRKTASILTLGQFIKSIASFLGPILTAMCVTQFANWKLIFPAFGIVTVLVGIWLLLTNINKESTPVDSSTFSNSFSLLKNKQVLTFFLGILFLVGVDVGLNISIPKILMEHCKIALKEAGYGTSTYFAARTIGSLIGSILLSKLSRKTFLIVTMLAGCFSLFFIAVVVNLWLLHVLIFLVGLCIANVFSIIFAAVIRLEPFKVNELSGLMIVGVSGGAIVPLIAGYVADLAKGQLGALFVLFVAMLYLLFCGFKMTTEK